MTKRSKITLFGLLALIAAFGLVLTGCPDPNVEEQEVPVYKTVLLKEGSHGFPADNAIIALTDGSEYVVRTTAGWHGVDQDGKLLSAETNLLDAIDPAGDHAPLAGTSTIMGVKNGTDYSVFKVVAAASDANATIDATATGGLNTIYDASVLATADRTITISAGVGGMRGLSSLVILTLPTDSQLPENAGEVSVHTRIKGTTAGSGRTYSFAAPPTGGSAKLEAVKNGAKYFVLNDINALFGTTITSAAALGTVKLASAASQGAATVGGGGIDTLTSGAKYVVQWRDGWYPLTATGLGTKGSLVGAAQAAIAAPGLASAAVTGLINDEIYNVFAVGALTAGQVINTNLEGSGTKNAIADVSALPNDGKTFKLKANAGASTASTIHFIVKEPIVSVSGTNFNLGAPLQLADALVVQCTGIKYTTSSLGSGNAAVTILAKEEEQFFTLSVGTTDTTITFTTGS